MTQRFSDGARGYGLGLVCLPIAALPTGAGPREIVTVVMAVLLAAVVAAAFVRLAATRGNIWLGPLLVAVAAVLYSVTPAGVSTAIIALLVGAGAGLSTGGGRRPLLEPAALAGGVFAVVLVLGVWLSAGTGSTLPFVVAAVSSVLAVTVLAVSGDDLGTGVVDVDDGVDGVDDGVDGVDGTDADERGGGTARHVLVGSAVAFAAVMVVWTGCNDPQLSWFGPVDAHGPRDVRQVAITFDDGPNDTASLEVARLLDERGVKGTFFEVGRAVRERPDVARRLVADGHLVGNHSFHHDYYGWLNPLYPELGATQRVIDRDVGVCPRFFRPPHGQRTPFMNLQLARRGMVAVTWDTSAGDWATTDAHLVARRILDRVRPGSIILLHDSLDGHVDADRRVVIEALPIILDGLQQKGLEPVRIDRLLGGPAYLPSARCR